MELGLRAVGGFFPPAEEIRTLLQAFEAEFMPLPEVFLTIPGYTASIEGAMAGVVLQLQGTDHAIFSSGLSYATTRDGN